MGMSGSLSEFGSLLTFYIVANWFSRGYIPFTPFPVSI